MIGINDINTTFVSAFTRWAFDPLWLSRRSGDLSAEEGKGKDVLFSRMVEDGAKTKKSLHLMIRQVILEKHLIYFNHFMPFYFQL